MKTTNRGWKYGLILYSLLLVGCAHRSGQAPASRGIRPIAPAQVATPRTRTSVRTKTSLPQPAVSTSETKLQGHEVFQRYNQAVFVVYSTDGTAAYQGSGFFIDNHGLAVSNDHVFHGSLQDTRIKLVGQQQTFPVTEIIARSTEPDFILFRVGYSSRHYLPLARQKPKIGERVYAIGSPRGLENTFSSGEVSQWRDDYLMQISVLIDHGSSGGALINEYGEAVGITSGTFYDGSQANLNYAWSIDVLRPYLNF